MVQISRLNNGGIFELAIYIQFLLIAITYLTEQGITFPLITPAIAVIGLTIIPGYLFLSALNLDRETPNTVTAFLTVLSSLVIIMVCGVVTNVIYLRLGFDHPLAPFPLGTTIFITCFLLYIYNKLTEKDGLIAQSELKNYNLLLISYLFILPVCGIFASYLLKVHNSNIAVILVLAQVAIIPIVITFFDIPRKYHSLIIWSIALTTLLSINLSYNYLGSAIEYTDMFPVLNAGYWSPDMEIHRNTNLSLMILYPTYTLLSGESLIWTMRHIYLLFLSILPVIIYWTFIKRFGPKTSFLAAAFVLATHTYFVKLALSLRTGTSVLFMAGVFYMLLDNSHSQVVRKTAIILFTFGTLVSHYGTGHLFVFAMGVGLLLWLSIQLLNRCGAGFKLKDRFVPVGIILIAVLGVSWDLIIAPNRFQELVVFGTTFIQNIVGIELYSQNTDAAAALFSERSLAIVIIRYLYITSIGLITIGLISQIIDGFKTKKFSTNLLGPQLAFYALIGLSATPVFARYDVRRIYAIGIIVLAPLAVIGFMRIVDILHSTYGYDRMQGSRGISLSLFATFIMIFLLFSSGVIPAVTIHGESTNQIVDKEYTLEKGDFRAQFSLLHRDFTDCEYQSSRWIANLGNVERTIYKTGTYQSHFALGIPHRTELQLKRIPVTMIYGNESFNKGEYIYVGEWTSRSNRFLPYVPKSSQEAAKIDSPPNVSILDLESGNKIYETESCEIYYH